MFVRMTRSCSRASTATGPNGWQKSSMPCFARRRLHGGAPILCRAAPHLSPCRGLYPCYTRSTSSHRAQSPPLRTVPHPSHGLGAADAVVPHQEVVPTVNAGCRRDAWPQLTTSRDPKWPDPERASLAAPCARFLRRILQAYVSSVSDILKVCCKCSVWMLQSRSECCICWNWCTCMLQTSISNVSSVFSDACWKYVYLDVIYVSHICCKCFIWMLHMFCNGFQVFFRYFCECFIRTFQMFRLPSYVCFKCYI
jgi:hypothetical protein